MCTWMSPDHHLLNFLCILYECLGTWRDLAHFNVIGFSLMKINLSLFTLLTHLLSPHKAKINSPNSISRVLSTLYLAQHIWKCSANSTILISSFWFSVPVSNSVVTDLMDIIRRMKILLSGLQILYNSTAPKHKSLFSLD